MVSITSDAVTDLYHRHDWAIWWWWPGWLGLFHIDMIRKVEISLSLLNIHIPSWIKHWTLEFKLYTNLGLVMTPHGWQIPWQHKTEVNLCAEHVKVTSVVEEELSLWEWLILDIHNTSRALIYLLKMKHWSHHFVSTWRLANSKLLGAACHNYEDR